MSGLYGVFDGRQGDGDLEKLCLGLLSEQKRTWPELALAYNALEQTRCRDLQCTGFSVRLLHNPGRLKSTAAKVGEADINRRPCFLCDHNLPEAQKGIAYRRDYVILANPMPVTAGHFTIPHLSHCPQMIRGNVDVLLALATDLGRGWTVLYNGPRCGASAPDHLHFQAIPAGRTPIEGEIEEEGRLLPIEGPDGDGVLRYEIRDVGRKAVLLRGEEPASLSAAVELYIRKLAGPDQPEEPMINIVARREAKGLTVLLFPRRKHRPDAYFREGEERIVVSPAVVEMAGLIVTPLVRDFEHLDRETIEAIYREVSGNHGPRHSTTGKNAEQTLGQGKESS